MRRWYCHLRIFCIWNQIELSVRRLGIRYWALLHTESRCMSQTPVPNPLNQPSICSSYWNNVFHGRWWRQIWHSRMPKSSGYGCSNCTEPRIWPVVIHAGLIQAVIPSDVTNTSFTLHLARQHGDNPFACGEVPGYRWTTIKQNWFCEWGNLC